MIFFMAVISYNNQQLKPACVKHSEKLCSQVIRLHMYLTCSKIVRIYPPADTVRSSGPLYHSLEMAFYLSTDSDTDSSTIPFSATHLVSIIS